MLRIFAPLGSDVKNRTEVLVMLKEKPRYSTLGDTQIRKKHITILGLSGASFAAAGSVTILDLQEYLLTNLPDILQRFPGYQNYFSVSTWLAFAAGLLFVLFPITFTLWVSAHLIGVSVLYLIGAVRGIAELSSLAFIVPYWATVIAVLIQNFGDSFRFYFKNTHFDGWALVLFKGAFLAWSIVLFIQLY